MSVLGLQSDADADEDFSFLQPLDLLTKDPYELHNIVKAKKEENLRQHKLDENKKVNDLSQDTTTRENAQEMDKERKERENEREIDKTKTEKEREPENGEYKETQHPDQNDAEKHEDKIMAENIENGTSEGKYTCFLFPFYHQLLILIDNRK